MLGEFPIENVHRLIGVAVAIVVGVVGVVVVEECDLSLAGARLGVVTARRQGIVARQGSAD